MYRGADRPSDPQPERNKKKLKETERPTERKRGKEEQRDRLTERQKHRQRDRATDRPTYRQQTNRNRNTKRQRDKTERLRNY
jgi:hypothetical protein